MSCSQAEVIIGVSATVEPALPLPILTAAQ